ncbi:MAG: universal stress protein [Rubrobacter sp.]|nr:universal stress protein [Rubrobacter sp.]
MEHRGVTGRPQRREQAPPADQSPAASELSGPAPSRATRNGLRKSRKTPVRWTGGDGQTGANGASYSAVLAAIDGTSSSAEVGWHAVRLAEGLGAKLFVLSFVNARLASRMGVYRSLALAELERDSREAARQTEEMAEKSGVECETRRALDPHPSRAIVDAAEKVRAGCIVIGSPGASVVDRLLDRAVGAVYEKVLREAECPVFSVRR